MKYRIFTLSPGSTSTKLAVFDDEFNEPLKIYGGPEEAAFMWRVTPEGEIVLSDALTGPDMVSARTRSEGDKNGYVDIGQINMSCEEGEITYDNTSHRGSLKRAKGLKGDLVKEWMGKSTLPEPCITDSIPVEIFPDYMNYVFNYPSVDPFGKPCTLSGTITVNKSLISEGKPFHGILLYNHFTIYATTQAPSRGAVEFPTGAAMTDFIVGEEGE